MCSHEAESVLNEKITAHTYRTNFLRPNFLHNNVSEFCFLNTCLEARGVVYRPSCPASDASDRIQQQYQLDFAMSPSTGVTRTCC